MNSKIGNYLLKDSPKTGTGDLLISVQAIEPVKIPPASEDLLKCSDELIEQNTDYLTSQKMDYLLYEKFNFTFEEIEFLESKN